MINISNFTDRFNQSKHLAVVLGVSVLAGCSNISEKIPKIPSFERASTRLAEADFGPQTRYAVVVAMTDGNDKSMHGDVIKPLAKQVAAMLKQELGADIEPMDHSPESAWNSELAKSRSSEGTYLFADFMRSQGYAGYALVELLEATDTASRNDLDYSVRARVTLRELGVPDPLLPDEEVKPEESLAKTITGPQVCFRRLAKPPGNFGRISAKDGYVLTDVPRCAKQIGSAIEFRLLPVLQKRNS